MVTVDVHSHEVQRLMPLPLPSLSPAHLLANEITRMGWREATLVAPDEGAMERCEAVRISLETKQPVVCLQKERTDEGVRHLALHGEVGVRAVVVDDILDTGGTLVSCCEQLQGVGVRDILVMVTHGQFTGMRWQRLWSLGVTWICCTDTMPLPESLDCDRITVLFYDAGTLVTICAKPMSPWSAFDCCLAAQNLMLAACEMGLGTCPIGFAKPWLDLPEVKRELGIPDDYVPVFPVIIGVPQGDTPAHPRNDPEIVSWKK